MDPLVVGGVAFAGTAIGNAAVGLVVFMCMAGAVLWNHRRQRSTPPQ